MSQGIIGKGVVRIRAAARHLGKAIPIPTGPLAAREPTQATRAPGATGGTGGLALKPAAWVVAAALLMALLAVAMTAGPTQAQRTGNNADHYDSPVPCSEEAKPGADTVEVISDADAVVPQGVDAIFFPVFEGFWDYEVGHLSMNFCPPKVEHTSKKTTTIPPTELQNNRTDANIHISETVFAIPDSYKVTATNSGTPGNNEISLVDYPFLDDVVSANDSLWWVRLDEPGTTADETSPLEIGFSTALMKDADWFKDENEDEVSDGPPVQFKFAAVHVLKDGSPLEAHVVGAHFFVFDERETDTALAKPRWSNVKTDTASEIHMYPGDYTGEYEYDYTGYGTPGYRPMQFAFTQPGDYLVQVQVQGHVRTASASPISPDDTITSPVQWYTFHVGPQADLDVILTHTDETSGDDTTTVTDGTASFSVTAGNHGPDTSEDVVVEVNLPVGLEYVPSNPAPADVTDECGVISWRVGDLASGASETLNFTANVGSGAPKSLTVDAEAHSSTADHKSTNDSASAEVLLSSTQVRPPYFGGVTRSLPEHAIAGTHAGLPVAASNPDARQLHYSLSGRCNDWFEVHSNGQITLASGVSLDYDEQSEFHLTISVSDRVNSSGGTDTAIDDSEPVHIRVIDTEDSAVHPTVTFSLSNPNSGSQPNLDLTHPVAGYTVSVDTELHNLPEGATPVYDWQGDGYIHSWSDRFHTSSYPAQGLSTGPATYTVHIKWDGGGITAKHTIEWFDADSDHPGP